MVVVVSYFSENFQGGDNVLVNFMSSCPVQQMHLKCFFNKI